MLQLVLLMLVMPSSIVASIAADGCAACSIIAKRCSRQTVMHTLCHPTQAPGPDPSEVEQPESDGPRDTVLVTDAESAMGEQVVLQLILAR